MECHKIRWSHRVLATALVLMFASQARAEGTPPFDAYYANHPKEWFDAASEIDYFNPSITRSWQLNESCNDTGFFSVASYNIFHNVPFVTDFGDEMEQSLGEVTRCADVVLYQEAWDYDDIIQDGPKADLAARGYSMLTPTGFYCDDSREGAIENDCSGLVIFYKTRHDAGARAAAPGLHHGERRRRAQGEGRLGRDLRQGGPLLLRLQHPLHLRQQQPPGRGRHLGQLAHLQHDSSRWPSSAIG